jgi:AraC family transcriptional regulator of adaptative response / DNA-3-methyladenine glycosylase II
MGTWTVNYVKLRGCKDPDVWLAGDAGINSALNRAATPLDIASGAPWRSYLTFQVWNQLSN